MALLEPGMHSALTRDAIEKLRKRKIRTALSFVETDPEIVARITGLHYTSALQARNAILTRFSSPLLRGCALYDEIVNHCAIVRTGIENLDKLLDGGLMTGRIYELCGVAASGKTQICATVAANVCASLKDQNVLYVDTKNDVTARRFHDAIRGEREDIAGVMNRIKMASVTKANDLLAFLHALGRDLKASSSPSLAFRLLIVDSLASLFFRYINDDERLVLLNNIANALHFLAVEFHLAILVTNLITKWTATPTETSDCDEQEGERETHIPVLGKYWMHVPDTRVSVKRLEDSEDRLLVVMKSCSQAAGKTTRVTVTSAGVR